MYRNRSGICVRSYCNNTTTALSTYVVPTSISTIILSTPTACRPSRQTKTSIYQEVLLFFKNFIFRFVTFRIFILLSSRFDTLKSFFSNKPLTIYISAALYSSLNLINLVRKTKLLNLHVLKGFTSKPIQRFWLTNMSYLNISIFRLLVLGNVFFFELMKKENIKNPVKRYVLFNNKWSLSIARFIKNWVSFYFKLINISWYRSSLYSFFPYVFYTHLFWTIKRNYKRYNKKVVRKKFRKTVRNELVKKTNNFSNLTFFKFKLKMKSLKKRRKKLFKKSIRKRFVRFYSAIRYSMRLKRFKTDFFFKSFFPSNHLNVFKNPRKLRFKNFKSLDTGLNKLSNLMVYSKKPLIKKQFFFNSQILSYYSGLHWLFFSYKLSYVSVLLRSFRLDVSRLLRLEPIRRLIIQFHKKNISSFFFSEYRKTWNKKLSKLFKSIIFENKMTYKRLKKYKTTNAALWVSSVTPKSLNFSRRQFFVGYRKRLRYQYRITRYIIRYYRYKVLELSRITEFNVLNILLRSQLFYQQTFALDFLTKGFVFVNGMNVRNSNVPLYPFDTLNVVVYSRFYIYYKWNLIFFESKISRFLYFTKYWSSRRFRPYPKQPSYRIPHWVIFLRYSFYEIPNYIEVDFLTLTVIILLFYYQNIKYYNFYTFKETPFATVRNHNWKILT